MLQNNSQEILHQLRNKIHRAVLDLEIACLRSEKEKLSGELIRNDVNLLLDCKELIGQLEGILELTNKTE